MSTSEQEKEDLFLLNFLSDCSNILFVSVYGSKAWSIKYLCRVVLRRVLFWSINGLMNKHVWCPISFIKITDKMWQPQFVARLHRNIKKKEISQKKTDVWPQRTHVELLISDQGVNRQ